MKKKNKFADLNEQDMKQKLSEITKELVSFRLSMDPSFIKAASNFQNLQKDFKTLVRQRFLKKEEIYK